MISKRTMREAEEWWTVHFVKKHGRKPWKDMRIIEKQKTIQAYLEAVVGYDADSYGWKYDNYPPQLGTETKDHQTSKKLANKLKKLQAKFARELELGAEGFVITENGEVGEMTKKKPSKPKKEQTSSVSKYVKDVEKVKSFLSGTTGSLPKGIPYTEEDLQKWSKREEKYKQNLKKTTMKYNAMKKREKELHDKFMENRKKPTLPKKSKP